MNRDSDPLPLPLKICVYGVLLFLVACQPRTAVIDDVPPVPKLSPTKNDAIARASEYCRHNPNCYALLQYAAHCDKIISEGRAR